MFAKNRRGLSDYSNKASLVQNVFKVFSEAFLVMKHLVLSVGLFLFCFLLWFSKADLERPIKGYTFAIIK